MSERNGISPRVFVPKGWGWEDWIVNKAEYCGKVLFFKKGKKCSWHYHKLKDETFYIQSGELLVMYADEDCLDENGKLIPELCSWEHLKPGDRFYVPPGMRHQMTGLTDCYMFEFSTTHFDEDSYRVIKGD